MSGVRVSIELPGDCTVCWVLVMALPLTVPAMRLTWPQAPVHPASRAGLASVTLFSMWLGIFAWLRGLAMGGVLRVRQVRLLQPFIALLADRRRRMDDDRIARKRTDPDREPARSVSVRASTASAPSPGRRRGSRPGSPESNPRPARRPSRTTGTPAELDEIDTVVPAPDLADKRLAFVLAQDRLGHYAPFMDRVDRGLRAMPRWLVAGAGGEWTVEELEATGRLYRMSAAAHAARPPWSADVDGAGTAG